MYNTMYNTWHEVTLNEHSSAAVVWCKNHVGEHNLDWYTNSYYRRFWFKDEHTATLFALRWA